jgi:hypothetical protein
VRTKMSLTRVASIDGFDRARRGSSASSHRRMSFSPFNDAMPPKDRKASIVPIATQYDQVSKQKRIGVCSVLLPATMRLRRN